MELVTFMYILFQIPLQILCILDDSTQVSMSGLLPPAPHGTPASDTRISCVEQRRGHGGSTGQLLYQSHLYTHIKFSFAQFAHCTASSSSAAASAVQFNKHYSYPLFCKTQGPVSLGQNKAYIKAKLSTPSASNKGLIIIERNPYKMCKDYNQRSMLTNI